MDVEDLTGLLKQDSAISTYLVDEELADAISDAQTDTGWDLPVTDAFQVRWLKHRAKRNCFFKLWSASARKFKVDSVAMNQRFDQYGKLIKIMDDEFKAIIDERPEKFSSVDPYKMFGTVEPAGFVYDITGKDVTDYSS